MSDSSYDGFYAPDKPRPLAGYKLIHSTRIRSWDTRHISDGMTREELGHLVMEFNQRFAYQLFIQQDMDNRICNDVVFYAIHKDSCMEQKDCIPRTELDEMHNFVLGFMKACQAIRKRNKQR